MSFITKIFGNANEKYLKKIQPLVDKINSLEKEFEKFSNEKLKEKTVEFKERLKRGETLDEILPEAFALVREAAKRTLNQRHFDVQLIGGIVLHQGKIAEMKTGEGKTLVATLPAYLNALNGKGVHIVTVNDYLAKRDTVWMGQIYHLLGLSVGCIVHDAAYIYDPEYQKEIHLPTFYKKVGGKIQNDNLKFKIDEKDKERDLIGGFKVIEDYLRPVSRKEAYRCDVIYGTNNEFGFDYLRDNLVYDLSQKVQREFNYAIIDEVDSILIDEARTPLIISGPAEESTDLYFKLAALVKRLKVGEDYNIDEKMKSVALTEKGQEKMVQWLGVDPWQTANFSLVHHIEAALRAETLFQKDRDYVVKDGEIIIVDEFTGRLMPGRRYSEGLHQAIEAKEGVEVKQESRTLATITFQNYFRMYQKLAGMTGTAATEAEEFGKIYNLDVIVIPTNRPLIRIDLPDKIYQTEEARWQAVVEEIKQRHQKGQPVLVGTVSIEKNEKLSRLLELNGIPHQVLNAKNHEKEGQIIAQAGKLGAVTVATNMAGRGVDIILGGNPPDLEEQKKVIELGGLHVIGTERHEARRIDNQLRGRSGRQGDPGSSQFFISLEDDLMRIFGGERLKNLMTSFKMPENLPIENNLISRAIESAQKKVEGMNFDLRKHLLDYDDVLNKQRETIYRKRREILIADHTQLRSLIFDMISGEIERVVSFHTVGDAQEKWDLKEIVEVMRTIFPCPTDLEQTMEDLREQAGTHIADVYARDRIIKYLIELANLAYNDLEKRILETEKKIGEINLMEKIERLILLQSIDHYWLSHLEIMENLRSGIGLRAYGQRDPLIEYKKESYLKFNELLVAIERQVVYTIYKVGLIERVKTEQPREIKLSGPSKTTNGIKPITDNKKKVGRNDPCPCGSGKKYKRCHGA
ncbi:MAG: preprotein translocase subunit SecA [Patescibacteria group bacterium]